MKRVLKSVASVQGGASNAVKVRITLPAVISSALGSYVQLVKEVLLVNVPVPLDVHKTPLLFVATDPSVIFTAPEPEHV
jgi:hypothetical protein